jgi:hypothetical protein
VLIFAGTDEERALVVAWAAERIEAVRGSDFGPCQAAGVVVHGQMAAAVIFHDWQDGARTMQLSMAADSPRWAAPAVLRGLFRYAFVTAGANKLWTATPHTNARALRFNHGIGMKQEATLRHHFGPKSHAVICSMIAAEWQRSKWFKG